MSGRSTAYEDRIDIEESVYLAATRAAPDDADRDPRACRKVARIQWTISLTAASPVGLAAAAAGETAPSEKGEVKSLRGLNRRSKQESGTEGRTKVEQKRPRQSLNQSRAGERTEKAAAT